MSVCCMKYIMPVYRAAIQEAGAGAVMDSYNPVNGVYATQNDYLNNQVLRNNGDLMELL